MEEWLGHKPGQVLKYLVCERGRVVPLEELLEVFWPHAGRAGRRERPPGDPHAARPARAGPPQAPRVGLRAGAPGRLRAGPRPRRDRRRRLRGAGAHRARRARPRRRPRRRGARRGGAAAYGGGFLADEPYAEWALGGARPAAGSRRPGAARPGHADRRRGRRGRGHRAPAAARRARAARHGGPARPARADAAARAPLRGAAPLRARPPALPPHLRDRPRADARGPVCRLAS